MVATTEDTADTTGAIFSVTLVSEMITGALDASQFEMTVVLRVTISLAVGALCNVPFLFRRFKCYFILLEVFDEEDVLIVWDRLQVHKEHGEMELGTKLLNIPNVGDRVAEFLNFCFIVGRIDGVVHVLQNYPVVAFFLRLISVKVGVSVSQGYDNCSVGVRSLWLDLDLVLGKGFCFIVPGCDLL
jgi:hypothetical protein